MHSNCRLVNPFVRGYKGLSIQRQVAIAYADDCPLCYLPLHSSQETLTDEQIARYSCIFSDDFALITEGQDVSPELDTLCWHEGAVRAVIYAVMAIDDDGGPLHVGDVYTLEAAQAVLQRLTFETGFYSRCWEISTNHLTADALNYLGQCADAESLTGLLFEVFHVPHSHTIGIKLISTPWSDENLMVIDSQTAAQLREEHCEAGVPESLAHVLQLAGLADTCFLLFDPGAPLLEGLPLYPA